MNDPDTHLGNGSRAPAEPTPDQVNAQIQRIFASREFAQSHRLKKFLDFIVQETIAGRSSALKEYSVALEVFDRDESFDPQTSSIVRVEASRLRAKLRQYYATAGVDDPIEIGLPVGSYVPTFSPSERPQASRADATAIGGAPQWPRMAALTGLILLLVGGAVFLFVELGPDTFQSGETDAMESSDATYAVAVLPLRNLSDEPDQDYFSDGLTEALIARLAKDGRGRVISTTSVMAYKNVNRPVSEIARELNVSHVIEGSVLLIGGKVRITVQLVHAASGEHLWAETYDRDVADVLAIQNDVVGRIVASLSGRVAASQNVLADDVPSVDPAAYEAQLRGRYFRNTMTAEGFRKGIAYFEAAIENAPDYALAYSGMASCYCLLSGHGFELVAPHESMPTAKQAVQKAIDLDPNLSEPHAFLGITRLKYDWDWPGAEQAFARAIELNPSDTQALIFYSVYFEAMGRQDEAIRVAEEARAIDPLSLAVNVNLGWQYLQTGSLDRARQVFESTRELNPDFWSVHWGLGHYHRRNGDHERAVEAFQTALGAGGGHTLPLTALGHTYAISDRHAQARTVLAELKRMSGNSYVSPYNMAVIHAGLGEVDEAFEWLDRAYEDRSRSMVWLNVADELDPLRADPRFASLVRQVGLPSSDDTRTR